MFQPRWLHSDLQSPEKEDIISSGEYYMESGG